MSTEPKDYSALANKATTDAKSKGTSIAHNDAAVAHTRAAKLASSLGDHEQAQEHLKAASKHKAKAKDLDAESDTSSDTASQVKGAPNPLLTWVGAKS